MSNNIIVSLVKCLLAFIPYLFFVYLDSKANLKKIDRSRQFYMPILALIYSLVLLVMIRKIGSLCEQLLRMLPDWLTSLGEYLKGALNGAVASASADGGFLLTLLNILDKVLEFIGGVFELLGKLLHRFIGNSVGEILSLVALNTFAMVAHVILKRILISLLKPIFKTENHLYESVAKIFYSHDTKDNAWYLKVSMTQARKLLKVFFWMTVCVSTVATLTTTQLFLNNHISVPFYSFFAVIVIGEAFFFLDGVTKEEETGSLSGEEDRATGRYNYALLRKKLRQLFGDKLVAEDTNYSSETASVESLDEIFTAMELQGDKQVEGYVHFMRARQNEGHELDRNYLYSGRDLLLGKSVLFNDPFYYDLIPYAFYAMDRTLLRHRKVLIILGRHGIEQDIMNWCEEGMQSISHIPELWNIGMLGNSRKELDVGIVSRSDVHNLAMHEANSEFFENVSLAVLIEPSKLITTAQLGLNSIIRHFRSKQNEITFCSTDKNCDGLVDALSHVLMTSISEVSATGHQEGVSSYMCWAPDEDYWQHRMLPNLSRYLGIGTELSFAALKNQIPKASWYGGERFPVLDMRWIVKQYYPELMPYADLPETQDYLDKCFVVSPNMWNERRGKNRYLTVEDESFNMFEIKRNFSTRASNQCFVNVISPAYLLRDYMAENESLFNADPKAIPYLVADYARTKRNVALRLCLRLCSGYLFKEDIKRELSFVDVDTKDCIKSLWHEICSCSQPAGKIPRNYLGEEIFVCHYKGVDYTFDISIIQQKRKFSMKSGAMEEQYSISDEVFRSVILSDLQNARYIAEDEAGRGLYLGTELQGHIYQKYLPGQFLTMCGKYYEMLSVTSEGHVMLRRAADHIEGRPEYRQVRRYIMTNAIASEEMGSVRTFGQMQIVRQRADFSVETPAYWSLTEYNDFQTGKKATINGIPTRQYWNKQILRISFLEGDASFPAPVRKTLTLLINEVFRTLFAENQDYILAVTSGDDEIPATYMLLGAEGFEPDQDAIYILEDSQMDIGLLETVERNLSRILSIVCDYLQWHFEELENSLHPPVPQTPLFDIAEAAEESTEKKPKTKLGRFFQKIAQPFKKIGKRISDFFKKIFRRKGVDPSQDTGSELETPSVPELVIAESAVEVAEPMTEETVSVSEETEAATEEKPETEIEQTSDASTEDVSETEHVTTDSANEKAEAEVVEMSEALEEQLSITDNMDTPYSIHEDDESEETMSNTKQKGLFSRLRSKKRKDDSDEPEVLFSISYKADASSDPVIDEETEESFGDDPADGEDAETDLPDAVNEVALETVAAEAVPEEAISAEAVAEEPTAAEETDIAPGDAESGEETEEKQSVISEELPNEVPSEEILPTDEDVPTEEASLSMPEDTIGIITDGLETPEILDSAQEETLLLPSEESADMTASDSKDAKDDPASNAERKPYHERYYLLYGNTNVPEYLDLEGTLAFLKQLGCDRNGLKQARENKSIADLIERSYIPNEPGKRFCDFCGVELVGTDYDVLADGRERCPHCRRTAVKTEAEFKRLYQEVVENLSVFFGVNINVPVRVQMVNAKQLHKRLGKSFVPTGKSDGRILGVAQKDKKGKYTIMLENGAPRLASVMTLAHEMTHIWQYTNWNAAAIKLKYAVNQLAVYEGMAKWTEIQYAYLIGETATAKREEMITRVREDEYGKGFKKYVARYPLSTGTQLEGDTPFLHPDEPLD